MAKVTLVPFAPEPPRDLAIAYHNLVAISAHILECLNCQEAIQANGGEAVHTVFSSLFARRLSPVNIHRAIYYGLEPTEGL